MEQLEVRSPGLEANHLISNLVPAESNAQGTQSDSTALLPQKKNPLVENPRLTTPAVFQNHIELPSNTLQPVLVPCSIDYNLLLKQGCSYQSCQEKETIACKEPENSMFRGKATGAIWDVANSYSDTQMES